MGDILFLNRQFNQAAQLYQKADQATPEGSDYAVYQQAMALGLIRQYYPSWIYLIDLSAVFLILITWMMSFSSWGKPMPPSSKQIRPSKVIPVS
jgi:hypothetical protein